MSSYNPSDWSVQSNSLEQNLLKTIKRNNDQEESNPSRQKQNLKHEITVVATRLIRLQEELQYIDDPLHFVYEKGNKLTEEQNWCFDNDIVFKLELCSILDGTYIALVVKTETDAMAYKLKWLE